MLPVDREEKRETGFGGRDVRTEKWKRKGLDRLIYVCTGDWIREAQVDEMSEALVVGLVRERGMVLFLILSYNNYMYRECFSHTRGVAIGMAKSGCI